MLPDEFNRSNKLDSKYYIALMEQEQFEKETTAQKSMRLIRKRKQTFNKNLKSFIGGK